MSPATKQVLQVLDQYDHLVDPRAALHEALKAHVTEIDARLTAFEGAVGRALENAAYPPLIANNDGTVSLAGQNLGAPVMPEPASTPEGQPVPVVGDPIVLPTYPPGAAPTGS